ncbi:MAG TPA: TadE/TadG family type IV pilus assembly protein [Dongiaceae bacterium]|nr:TadE/TadG family type IV pilus assembly protein [Dongiaceae bacterium]
MSNQAGKHMKKNLWKCERGAVAPLVGVCIIMLVGAVGVAVDIGRGQVAQSKLQAALDSAGLAAGAIVGQNLTEEKLRPEAEKYLHANFGSSTIDATICDTCFQLNLSDDKSVVTLEAKATLPTTFMRIFGEKSMQVAARSEITRETTGLEVALVLDLTGSMNEPASAGETKSKMEALRGAADDLINILFGSHDTVDDLWVGIVPFASSVNIGASHTDWMSNLTNYTTQNLCIGPTSGTGLKCPSSPAPLNSAKVSTHNPPNSLTLVDRYMNASRSDWYFKFPTTGDRHTWRGCVLERWAGNRDVTDDTPSTQKFQTFFADDTTSGASPYNNNWRSDTSGNSLLSLDRDGNISPDELSANRGCPEYPITPLTNVKATLTSAINAMQWPNGYTHINVGAVWGWRLLSPKWRGVWGGDMDANSLPLDYDEPLSQKAMILMTDGLNTMYTNSYTAYGLLSDGHLGTTSSQSIAGTTLNTKTKTVCDAVKAKGIIVYTIVFGDGSDTTAKNMMKACASETDFYFDSPTEDALKTAFQAIGDSLSKLRVSR